MTTAKDITANIRWLLQDANLDRDPEFKVQTKRSGENWVTVVFGADHKRATEALTTYADNTPGIEFGQRVYDGNLTITQPSN